MSQRPFPRALAAPAGDIALLDATLIERAVAASRENPRGRVILPLHRSSTDPYQRMLNAAQPGSYIRPHRHRDPPKGETVVVLRGSVPFLTFREDGAVATSVVLAANSAAVGLDVRPGVYTWDGSWDDVLNPLDPSKDASTCPTTPPCWTWSTARPSACGRNGPGCRTRSGSSASRRSPGKRPTSSF